MRLLGCGPEAAGFRVDVEFEADAALPLSPASLYGEDDPAAAVASLHRLVAIDGRRAAFATSDPAVHLAAGARLIFRRWWAPRQLAIARDLHRRWRHRTFAARDATLRHHDGAVEDLPGGWDHEHCALCWSKLGIGGAAFESDDDWVCEPCHARFLASGFGATLGDAT